ncbi:MAG: UPF0182 family protein [Clostridiales bacterium]|nr:UPF0182 family protein [Clostridiales bacterium]MCF8021992.1 UPF0182 family protein [Clostridiales bacterium]
MKHARKFIYLALVAVLLAVIFLKWGVNLYVDYLWFDSVEYSSVFLKILLSDLGVRLITGLLTFIVLLFNLYLTRRPILNLIQKSKSKENDGIIDINNSSWDKILAPRVLNIIFIATSLVLALFVSTAIKGDWIIFQNFINATPFNTIEPVFQKDIGFYVFKLPFYQLIYQILMWITILSALTVGIIYLFINTGHGGITKLFNSFSARFHLSAIAAVFFVIKAWGYLLDQYRLLFSNSGVIFGAGYTDIHARLLALKILFVISLITAVIILINLFMHRFKYVLYSIGALMIVSIVLGSLYPAAIQNLIVSPNELVKEKQYIENNIKYTRKAYNLDNIKEKNFPAGQTLNKEDIVKHESTIKNIRLWDWRPLKSTYSQLQEMRLYYAFKNIDIDRYTIDGDYRQVMLSAREMDQDKLADRAKTWINKHLKFTHGFGIVTSPVNKISTEGLPKFFLKNIPPTGSTDLQVERPQIYYGESTDRYVIVNTATDEFDYPKGGENAYTSYKVNNGIKIGSIFKKAVLSLYLSDYRMFVASDIKNESQVLFRRNINERVPRIAPFLKYDSDPYIVLNNGKLYWMWDAYTTTTMYPYSDPFNGSGDNYIRNSVKVVLDAYTGEVDYYITEPGDPIAKTYQKIFPKLFKEKSEMPSGLVEHTRYPVDYFKVQANKYAVYHMNDPQIFYNKEDKWSLPTENYGNEETTMQPYYTIINLPGEKQKEEYVLIMPFTPKNKKNMISWLAARSDKEHYGSLMNFNFPKQELVYGPMQIEARINQDSNISQQISLWDQRGSNVIRGNLMVIPVKDSLLYVEPLYLQAEQSKLPELRRVIVANGDQIVMEPSLDLALERLFDVDLVDKEPQVEGEKEKTEEQQGPDRNIQELINEANDLYEEAQSKLRNGDWSGYGETMQELKEVLKRISQSSQKTT